MHDMLDDYVYTNAIRDVNPKLKLLLGLSCILICVSSTSLIAPLIVAFSMSLIILVIAKITWRLYARLLLVPLSFALLSSLAIIFMQGETSIFTFTILGFSFSVTIEGINLALLLLSRTLGGMTALIFIALTTPMIDIFSILKSYGLPDLLLELSMLIYRYIFLFLDEVTMIRNAQILRLGYSGFNSSLNSFAMLSSVLFLRAWEQGERLIVAMDSRCYNGHLEVMESRVSLSWRAIIAVVAYLGAITIIAVMTRDIGMI
jgi:cobalt/nickel transport system permease protein